MRTYTYFLLLCLIIISCKKSNTLNKCSSLDYRGVSFQMFETVLDTLLPTDTAYSQTLVSFKAGKNTYSSSWRIGNDPRVFTTESVNLVFNNPISFDATLTASYADECFNETKAVTKKFTIVSNRGDIVSPLKGVYHGYNIDNPGDTFSTSIKYWYGVRYNWWPDGAYSIQNLPKGYFDTTKEINGSSRPEITGIICSNGYKNLAIDKSGDISAQGIKGYASLIKGATDTLVISYKVIDTNIFNQTGQINYLQKKFIGIKTF